MNMLLTLIWFSAGAILLTVVPIWSIVIVCSKEQSFSQNKIAWIIAHLIFWTFTAIVVAFTQGTPDSYRKLTFISLAVFIIIPIVGLATG